MITVKEIWVKQEKNSKKLLWFGPNEMTLRKWHDLPSNVYCQQCGGRNLTFTANLPDEVAPQGRITNPETSISSRTWVFPSKEDVHQNHQYLLYLGRLCVPQNGSVPECSRQEFFSPFSPPQIRVLCTLAPIWEAYQGGLSHIHKKLVWNNVISCWFSQSTF